mmetsp:Transcript_6090/g.14793  ORF Transcript_6090/g.14793 Transcript_6090/m.14793 type:complete len:273 (+) Transcript_6090:16-834(+)
MLGWLLHGHTTAHTSGVQLLSDARLLSALTNIWHHDSQRVKQTSLSTALLELEQPPLQLLDERALLAELGLLLPYPLFLLQPRITAQRRGAPNCAAARCASCGRRSLRGAADLQWRRRRRLGGGFGGAWLGGGGFGHRGGQRQRRLGVEPVGLGLVAVVEHEAPLEERAVMAACGDEEELVLRHQPLDVGDVRGVAVVVVVRLLVDDSGVVVQQYAAAVVGAREVLRHVALLVLGPHKLHRRAVDEVDVIVLVVGRPDPHHVEPKLARPRRP